MINPKDFFTVEQKTTIENAIKEAELNTSGEIRVHLAKKCTTDVLDCAADIFAQLKMHKTEQRNGVLFFLAVNTRQFAILGDAGINEKVPEDFWNDVKNEVISNFKQEKFAEGLSNGIIMAGEKLKEHFAYQSDDVNELSDEISIG